MSHRSPARLLAPLALVVVAVALVVVVAGSGSGSADDAGAGDAAATSTRTPTTAKAKATPTPTPTAAAGPSAYTVKPGDTPSAIADATGVSVETLVELNPDLDAQSLTVGQRLKLR